MKSKNITGPVLIVGGAGFIGSNLAHRLLSARRPVVVFDNLSRGGVMENLNWLARTHGELLQVETGDVRDRRGLAILVRSIRPAQVFDFAAQVAVTTSLSDPVEDFEVNARGTLNLLESLRALGKAAPLVFTSTNKVYGHMDDVPLRANHRRYEPVESRQRHNGFSEDRGLSFQSPYGCSKGAAEQYVLDYARSYGLPTVVFRMSCIYGPHQFGTEDQGWVAHFLIRALEDETITIYGDGKQVRDVLFIDDLVNAFLLAQQHISAVRGEAFNIGGGPQNTVSLIELVNLIEAVTGVVPKVIYDQWRQADQRFYVSDFRRFTKATGWTPKVSVREGVSRLFEWLRQSRGGLTATSPSGHQVEAAMPVAH
ncbi:MAG TPA: GDP-mannose 4,6-dehydratase [Verrucomicrobiae bacterium]|nr:GDP-mannose 4,6-dehydratase [Verrucomicrobiae bacterium]